MYMKLCVCLEFYVHLCTLEILCTYAWNDVGPTLDNGGIGLAYGCKPTVGPTWHQWATLQCANVGFRRRANDPNARRPTSAERSVAIWIWTYWYALIAQVVVNPTTIRSRPRQPPNILCTCTYTWKLMCMYVRLKSYVHAHTLEIVCTCTYTWNIWIWTYNFMCTQMDIKFQAYVVHKHKISSIRT
jgi:hypothetical protein